MCVFKVLGSWLFQRPCYFSSTLQLMQNSLPKKMLFPQVWVLWSTQQRKRLEKEAHVHTHHNPECLLRTAPKTKVENYRICESNCWAGSLWLDGHSDSALRWEQPLFYSTDSGTFCYSLQKSFVVHLNRGLSYTCSSKWKIVSQHRKAMDFRTRDSCQTLNP